MKRIISILLVVMLISCIPFFNSVADAAWYGKVTVVSTTVSIRDQPDTRATRLYSAKNMDELYVVGEYYDWYYVDCMKSGLSDSEQYGYVLKCYTVMNGYYVYVDSSVKLYCDPWGTPYNNGQKGKNGEAMFVISETSDWLCCQLKTEDKQPGSCFIKKADIGWYSGMQYENQYNNQSNNQYNNQYNGYYNFSDPNNLPKGFKGTYSGYEYSNYIAVWKIPVNKGWSVGIREVPDKDTKSLIIIHSGDLNYDRTAYIRVNVIYNLGHYAYVRIDDPNRAGGFVEGYVQCKYFEQY